MGLSGPRSGCRAVALRESCCSSARWRGATWFRRGYRDGVIGVWLRSGGVAGRSNCFEAGFFFSRTFSRVNRVDQWFLSSVSGDAVMAVCNYHTLGQSRISLPLFGTDRLHLCQLVSLQCKRSLWLISSTGRRCDGHEQCEHQQLGTEGVSRLPSPFDLTVRVLSSAAHGWIGPIYRLFPSFRH